MMKSLAKLYQVKNEIIVLVILVPLVVLLGVMLARWPTPELQLPAPVQKVPMAEPTGMVAPATTGRTGEAGGIVEHSDQAVILVIDDGADKTEMPVAIEGTVSVADVLRLAAAEKKISVGLKDYGEAMGVLVEAINGVASDSEKNHYWYLYVNGQLSPVGASRAVVTVGDEIVWKYEQQKNE